MPYLKEKKIKGKKYYYLSKSLRLPHGKVMSIEKLVPDKNKPLADLERENLEFFIKREKQIFSNHALTSYSTDAVFSKEQIKKIEEI